MLFGRPWIHTVRVVTLSLHQCLKYIMDRMLVNIMVEEIASIVRNVVVPFIEAKDCKNRNIYAFKIVDTDWVPENIMLRRPKISKVERMTVYSFLEHGIPF